MKYKTKDDWLDEINEASFQELIDLFHALVEWSYRCWPFVESAKPFRLATRRALEKLTETK